MELTETVTKLNEFCAKKGIIFRIEKEGEENTIIYDKDKKEVIINFSNPQKIEFLIIAIKPILSEIQKLDDIF